MTIHGKKCKDEYRCGKHGTQKHEYWCLTEDDLTQECCAPPGDTCASGACRTGDPLHPSIKECKLLQL